MLSEIRLHELFFSSFGGGANVSRLCFGGERISAAGLLYAVKRAALKLDTGFVSLALHRGEVSLLADRECFAHFREREPLLAIDVCEHAYYGDSGFSKESYLERILPSLSLGRLSSV